MIDISWSQKKKIDSSLVGTALFGISREMAIEEEYIIEMQKIILFSYQKQYKFK